jgi:peptide/nickel transport system substrate-binding protein
MKGSEMKIRNLFSFKKNVTVTVIFGAIFSLIGLAIPGNAIAGTGAKTSVTWAITYSVNSLDPGLTYDSAGNNYVTYSICDSLMRYSSNLSVLKPGIASTVVQTSPTTYVYKLRPEAKFWDGNKVTAEDVAFSLNRVLDPKLASPLLSLVQAANFKLAKVTGPSEVTVTLTSPNPIAQWLGASPAGQIVEQSIVKKYGSAFGTAADKIMCSGPYKPVSYVKGDKTVIQKFKGYWDSSVNPKITEVTFREVPNTADIVAGLRSGAIDGTFDLTARDARSVESVPTLRVTVTPGPFINYLAPNFKKGPFSHLEVRQAFSMALDRAGMASAIDGPDGKALRGAVQPGLATFSKSLFDAADKALPVSDKPDIAKAKALLTKSGFAGSTVTIMVLSGTVSDILAAGYQSAGSKIGLKVKVIKASSSDFFAEAFSGKYPRTYDAMSIFFAPDIPDPSGLLVPPYASQFANQQGFASSAYEALKKQWSGSKNGSVEQAQALINMENMITNQQVTIPLNVSPLTMVTGKWMTGYVPTILYYYQNFMASM